jgi:hypothetical protein
LTNTQPKSKKQEKLAEQILSKQQERFRKLTQRKDLVLGQSPHLVKVCDRLIFGQYSNSFLPQIYSYLLQFGCTPEQPCKVGHTVEDILLIKNKSKNPINYYLYEPAQSPYFSVALNPAKNEVKKNTHQEIHVNFTLHKPCAKIQELLILEIEGGARYYIGIDIACEQRQFGVDPLDVELEHVEGVGTLPKVLVHMRHILEKYNAFETEGLFRLAGNDKNIHTIKGELNRYEYIDHGPGSINEIANLIKIWFRELPDNLFNAVSPSKLECKYY